MGISLVISGVDTKKLTAYRLHPTPIRIVRAGARREWMSATPNHFADRCLPLRIANQSGWWLLNPETFTASWTGEIGINAVAIKGTASHVTSHFGEGILTFHVPYLFDADNDPIWVKGPTNLPKDGISPLEGVVETGDNVATFTMNWIFTRPGSVTFEEGEPFAMIVPQPEIGFQSGYDCELVDIAEAPELEKGYHAWAASRGAFNGDPERKPTDWQKDYFRSRTQKIELRDFETGSRAARNR